MRQLDHALAYVCQPISYAEHRVVDPYLHHSSWASVLTELLIIDEPDRLKTPGLEQVRDYYDRHDLGVILIGMPGIEKRLAPSPQLYSRIGFAHKYRPLISDERQMSKTSHVRSPHSVFATAACSTVERARSQGPLSSAVDTGSVRREVNDSSRCATLSINRRTTYIAAL